MVTAQTFPGVYSKIIDNSFTTPPTSRFRVGLIGVAERGPFDTPVAIRSLKDYRRVFGRSIDNRYMANAAAILSDLTDGLTVVRVGRRYQAVASDGSGVKSGTSITTSKASFFSVGSYLRIFQPGKKTTVNAQIQSISGNQLNLASGLQDDYSGAAVESCPIGGESEYEAANQAEAFLYAYNYVEVNGITASGEKSSDKFTCNNQNTANYIGPGDLLKLVQAGRKSTREVLVKEVKPYVNGVGATVILESTNNYELGYQALPLQDNYTSASIYKAEKIDGVFTTTPVIHLLAATAGTWANSDGSRTGLIVKVSPGSKPDTKKLLVYEDSGLVETIDNLTLDGEDGFVARIRNKSRYITIPDGFNPGSEFPANTVQPWNLSAAAEINVAAFKKGANGLSPEIQDFVGTINPIDDTATGLKVFEDENVQVDVIVAPDISTLFHSNDMPVCQEMARIARKMFSVGLIDVPKGIMAREAIDWHNGEGLWAHRGKLDTYSLACWWNWIKVTDPFNGEQKFVPPTLGALRCLAATFDRYKPWFVAAGELRGAIPEASAVEFPRVSFETKSAMYGDGNSVNPILVVRGRILNFGERTLQRLESKLTALHNVILTNYILRGISEIGRRFIFDPNDSQLLDEMRIAFTGFMDGVQNERGIEKYQLVMDHTNNTPETRNRREVIVDLSFIPVDAVERIYVVATVRESGAELVSIR